MTSIERFKLKLETIVLIGRNQTGPLFKKFGHDLSNFIWNFPTKISPSKHIRMFQTAIEISN